MKLFGKEHYELMDQFEKQFQAEGRTDRETQDLWHMGVIYQDGKMNELFLAFRKGYALGKCVYQETPDLSK